MSDIDFCKCYVKCNVKCATCDKPFKTPETKEEIIKDLKRKIRDNLESNFGYMMDLEYLEG